MGCCGLTVCSPCRQQGSDVLEQFLSIPTTCCPLSSPQNAQLMREGQCPLPKARLTSTEVAAATFPQAQGLWGRAGFCFQSLFWNDSFFIFGFTAETDVFPQKMRTEMKPHFPKGIFFLMKKKKKATKTKSNQHSAWEWAEKYCY